MNPSISVSAGWLFLEDGSPGVGIKIQMPKMELNVTLTKAEIPLLRQVESASWATRSSLKLGRCANSPVFWSTDVHEVSILVGEDDETWDIAVIVPVSTMREIVHAVEAEQAVQPDRREDAAPG
jgi:hypothetical protein